MRAEAADLPPEHPLNRRPLADSFLDWYADLYFVAAQARGWPPDVVDSQELWQLWAALGHALADAEWQRLTQPPERPAPASSRFGRRRRGGREQLPSAGERDLIAERVAWLQGRGPKPEADDVPDRRLARVLSTAPGEAQERGTS